MARDPASAPGAALGALALSGWVAIVAAAMLDPEHDVVAHYISWLSDGPYAGLAALGVAALCLAAALAGRRLGRTLPRPWGQVAAVALLAAAAVGVGTLLLPSKGYGESVWHIGFHVGLAVGAYNGICLACGSVAYLQWRGRLAGPPAWPWLAAVLATLMGLLIVSAMVRVLGADTEWRGLFQLVLAGIAAGWLATTMYVAPSDAR